MRKTVLAKPNLKLFLLGALLVALGQDFFTKGQSQHELHGPSGSYDAHVPSDRGKHYRHDRSSLHRRSSLAATLLWVLTRLIPDRMLTESGDRIGENLGQFRHCHSDPFCALITPVPAKPDVTQTMKTALLLWFGFLLKGQTHAGRFLILALALVLALPWASLGRATVRQSVTTLAMSQVTALPPGSELYEN